MDANFNYRLFLKEELENRCRKNQSYSLRAYARDLGLTPGRLSDVLNNKSGLSVTRASEIAKILGLNSHEMELFTTLVEATDGRSRKSRQQARLKMTGLKRQNTKYLQLNLDQFKIISDWSHLTIIDLINTKGFQNDPQWIARRLGVSKLEAELSLGRLIRLGLVKNENGRLSTIDEVVSTPTDIPSETIKNFHRQILKKAETALDFQKVQERDFSCITIPIPKSLISESKEKIKAFRRKFNRWIQKNNLPKEEVYCLSIQFFGLTEEIK